jgi:hypothetical protein
LSSRTRSSDRAGKDTRPSRSSTPPGSCVSGPRVRSSRRAFSPPRLARPLPASRSPGVGGKVSEGAPSSVAQFYWIGQTIDNSPEITFAVVIAVLK